MIRRTLIALATVLVVSAAALPAWSATCDFVEISGGRSHHCGVRADGSAECWGYGDNGELVSAQAGVAQAAAGWRSTCLLDVAGSVECYGELQASPEGNFTFIAVGDGEACGILEDGSVRCWDSAHQIEPPFEGSFTEIALGNIDSCALRAEGTVLDGGCGGFTGTFRHVPVGAEFYWCGVREDGSAQCQSDTPFVGMDPPAASFTQVSAGREHACGLRDDGIAQCWGNDVAGGATPPAGTFTNVVAASFNTCGTRADGTLACWGPGYSGETSPPAGGFTQLTSNLYHSCGLRSDGRAECWGFVLGNDYREVRTPSAIFTQISTGPVHTCGVQTGGRVYCWGRAHEGQLDAPSGAFVQVAAGIDFSCAIRQSGSLDCWGGNVHGQASPPDGKFVQITAGLYFACALRNDGGVECWGNGVSEVMTSPPGTFTQISAGWFAACGIRGDGSVSCWGREYGETPEGIFTQVSAARDYACAVRPEGSLICWGYAVASRIVESAPADGIFVQVATGTKHACAIRADSSVHCWGDEQATLPACASSGSCGNAIVDETEACDDGNTRYFPGEFCDWKCAAAACGQPTRPDAASPLTTDALFALRAAVGSEICDARICDVNGSGRITVTDAQIILATSVGISTELQCPA